MTNTAKIGLGVLVVAAGFIWFRSGRGPDPAEQLPKIEERQPRAMRHEGETTWQSPQEAMQARLSRRQSWKTGRHLGTRDAGPLGGPGARGLVNEVNQAEVRIPVDIILHSADAEKRADAVHDLRQYDDEIIRPFLIQALQDSDAGVRRAAIEELLLAMDEEGDVPFEVLANAARDPDPEVRAEALEALDRLDDPRKDPVFVAALQDPSEDVRDVAQRLANVDDETSEDTSNDTDDE